MPGKASFKKIDPRQQVLAEQYRCVTQCATCIISILLNIDYKFVSFYATYYAYSRQIIPKKDFNDPALRELLTEIHVSGQRVGGAMATRRDEDRVGPKDLKSCLRE